MSRRTERPYQVDGTGRLAQHSEAPCSVPEINGPVVQREFTCLLRETCKCAPSETAGARVSNGPRAVAGVSRGRSTESHEPGNAGGSHNSGRAELGRQNTTIGGLVPDALKPIGRALGSDHHGRERVLLRPSGLPGTAGRGPACPVVWKAGGASLPPTRLSRVILTVVCVTRHTPPWWSGVWQKSASVVEGQILPLSALADSFDWPNPTCWFPSAGDFPAPYRFLRYR